MVRVLNPDGVSQVDKQQSVADDLQQPMCPACRSAFSQAVKVTAQD
jgi:hypothetical protein